MTKSTTQAMLTSAMVFSWGLIRAGARSVERSEAVGITDPLRPYAGFLETMVWRGGRAIVTTGESIELRVNALAMRLGYHDGEVSGFVAWPPTLAC